MQPLLDNNLGVWLTNDLPPPHVTLLDIEYLCMVMV
jgi:hypothetical protein